MKEFIYSLRIGICPDFAAQEKFDLLLQFCKKAKINDLQFFVNMEEVNNGHLTPEETKPWLDMLKGFRKRVKEQGMTFSLNPWPTTLHADRGRKLKEGQNFVTMVDRDGRSSDVVACPLGEDFQKYISEMFRNYADVGFDVIWVEDDFRLHNHAPLRWGGCFCDLHQKEFSREIGHDVSREAFCTAITAPGNPHPYRKVWLDVARRTMSDFAALLGTAVHSTAPQTRVGLMCSVPSVHCTEGRDWKTILANLSGNTRALLRPHLPAYREVTGMQYCVGLQRYSKLTAYMAPPSTELWPELENFPYTRFTKSHAFTRLQIESALAFGSEGITLNIFDMMGNGVAQEEHNDLLLAEIKPYLNGVKALDAHVSQECGVQVMYSPDSSYTIHADGKDTPAAFEPSETFWAEYLGAYGIAFSYCSDQSVSNQIVAVSGQYFRNMTCEEIERLFQNNFVLLNGDAAATLLDMGLGNLIGAKSGQWRSTDTGERSYEQVTNGQLYHGLSQARLSAQIPDGQYYALTYDREVTTYTDLFTYTNEWAGKGICVYQNALILPYGHTDSSFWSLLNPIRRDIIVDILGKSTFTLPVIWKGAPYVAVNHFDLGKEQMIFLTNFSLDPVHNVTLQLPFAVKHCRRVDRTTGQLENTVFSVKSDECAVSIDMAPLTTACLVMETDDKESNVNR